MVHDLNKTERMLYDYVVKNMDEAKHMSIQKFAAEMFLSTTSIFRFTKKLGFSGYSDFINSLIITSHNKPASDIPSVIMQQSYRDVYLNNTIESLRVMSEKKIEKVMKFMEHEPKIYIITDENTRPIIGYAEKLFIGLGLHAYGPETDYHKQSLVNRINEDDMIIALSYTGQSKEMNEFIKRIFIKDHPFLLSITRADNNTLASLSNVSFYIFADELMLNGVNMTSNVSMLMILELLVYRYMAHIGKTLDNQ